MIVAAGRGRAAAPAAAELGRAVGFAPWRVGPALRAHPLRGAALAAVVLALAGAWFSTSADRQGRPRLSDQASPPPVPERVAPLPPPREPDRPEPRRQRTPDARSDPPPAPAPAPSTETAPSVEPEPGVLAERPQLESEPPVDPAPEAPSHKGTVGRTIPSPPLSRDPSTRSRRSPRRSRTARSRFRRATASPLWHPCRSAHLSFSSKDGHDA
jgi:hypothetical protein